MGCTYFWSIGLDLSVPIHAWILCCLLFLITVCYRKSISPYRCNFLCILCDDARKHAYRYYSVFVILLFHYFWVLCPSLVCSLVSLSGLCIAGIFIDKLWALKSRPGIGDVLLIPFHLHIYYSLCCNNFCKPLLM